MVQKELHLRHRLLWHMTELNCDRAMDRREQPAVRCRWKVTELISIGNFTMMGYEAP